MTALTSLDALAALYGEPVEAAMVKETDRITPHYAALIAASPLAVLATAGPEGLDCSPRGDRPGFVHLLDARTLALPDWRGNNRIDSLRNIVRDPRVALLFLIPGSGTTFRVNGRAEVRVDADLLARFTVDGGTPRSAIVVTVETAYFQCARAIVRSALWSDAARAASYSLPTPGVMLAALSAGRVGGADYDAEWPKRAVATLW